MTGSEYNVTAPAPGQKIDIIRGLVKAWKQFKRSWWVLCLLLALCVGFQINNYRRSHSDRYEAFASFSVNVGNMRSGTANSNAQVSLKKLGETFPYILESGALKTVVREELGMSSLPGTISADVVKNTNLLRISVVGGNPELCCRILDAVIENYPRVAKYVLGKTTLTMLDYSGVPTEPMNRVSTESLVVKGATTAGMIYLGVLAVLIFIRRTVEDENDLKRYTSIRCLASIPYSFLKKRSKGKKNLLLIGRKSVPPAFNEAFGALRVRVLRELDHRQQKVLLLTSAGELEGKSTVAANLALSCARKGFRVLLIDGDLRHPSVAAKFGVTAAGGTADVLSGRISAAEAIQPWQGTTLDLLPGSAAVSAAEAAKLLLPERIEELIAFARKRYDYIFVDSPPCGIMQDALVLADSCDATLMVIRQDFLARSKILEVLDMLSDAEVGLIGCVINGESSALGSYGYGRYGYGSGYGQYGKYGRYGKYGSSRYVQKK